LAVTVALVPQAFPRDAGAIEGTVTGQDGGRIKGATVDIIQTAPEGRSRRFHVKTDQQGHFTYGGIPAGTYTVNVISHGRILKTIESVSVEAGRAQSLATIQVSDSGKKAALQPTQADIVQGCIAVRNITFQRGRLLLLNSNVGISGSITNSCGRDAYVDIDTSFFNANGDKIHGDQVQKLVGVQGAQFRSGPDPRSPEAAQATLGRVESVYFHFQP
jgi:hypothetical protein